jgi:hypothetical protein
MGGSESRRLESSFASLPEVSRVCVSLMGTAAQERIV